MPDVKPIPDGYPRLSPYIWVEDAAAAIDFYTKVLGATERMRMPMGDKIVHCELQLGDSVLMLADEFPEMGALAPKAVGGSPAMLSLFVEDVDSVCAKAVAAGATELRPIEDRFYGDRVGEIEDPFGHRWSLSTRVEDVSPEEIKRRGDAMAEDMGAGGG
jgi:PhnB protein